MSDLKQKILNCLDTPFLGSFATVTPENKPWVRYVMATINPETLTVSFATCATARKVQHIAANPAVHITAGASLAASQSPYVQIEGTAVLIQDKEKLRAAWNEMLGNYFEGPDDPNYALIEVTPSRIELCGANPENPMEPEIWEA
ncbi:MAG: pyridoxamine 5'-phosphate oxidase family protein [Planctomycetia bacterium]|jgi:general stress protein 26